MVTGNFEPKSLKTRLSRDQNLADISLTQPFELTQSMALHCLDRQANSDGKFGKKALLWS